MFKLFADLIAFYLEAQMRVQNSEAALLSERHAAELREQFIAVLGHDLRNPLASIDAGARLLLKEALSDKAISVVGLIQKSVSRMAGLIDDVLDFARGRLGGGLQVNRNIEVWLGPVLEQVVNELRAAWPGRAMETQLSLHTVRDTRGSGLVFISPPKLPALTEARSMLFHQPAKRVSLPGYHLANRAAATFSAGPNHEQLAARALGTRG